MKKYNKENSIDQEQIEFKVEKIINSLSIISPIDPDLIQLLLLIEGAMNCPNDIQLINILRKQFESVYVQDIREKLVV